MVLTDNDFFVNSKQTTDNQNLMSGEQWYTLKVRVEVCHVRGALVHSQGTYGSLSCPGSSVTPSRYVWQSVTPEKILNFLKETDSFGNI